MNSDGMETIKVFEAGSGKWVCLDEDVRVKYVSDEYFATAFDLTGLASANGYIEDFLIYKETLFAVPKGTNQRPWECDKVRAYISKAKSDE